MNRELSKEDVREIYDSEAKYYDFFELIWGFLGLTDLRRKLGKEAHRNILEVGIGTGKNLDYYSSKSKIWGIDLSKEMLKRARKKADRLGKSLGLEIGDAERLPYKNYSFDIVVDSLGLCTYPDPIKALEEMKRVCKKDGIIMLLEHGISNNSLIRKLQYIREERHYKMQGCHLTRNPEELARKAGLAIEKCERTFFGVFYLIKAKAQYN